MKIWFSLLIVSVLTGCSPYKHSFNCPVPKGYPCTSMSRIHELIDEGTFSNPTPDENCKTCSQGSCKASSKPKWVEAVIVDQHNDVRKYVLTSQGSGQGEGK